MSKHTLSNQTQGCTHHRPNKHAPQPQQNGLTSVLTDMHPPPQQDQARLRPYAITQQNTFTMHYKQPTDADSSPDLTSDIPKHHAKPRPAGSPQTEHLRSRKVGTK